MGRKRTFNFSKQNSLVDSKKKTKKDIVSVSESKNLNYNRKSLQKNVKEEKNGKNLNKRTKKKHELSCASKSNTNGIKNIPKIYVQGNMNQSSLIFGIYSGRQCVAVSLLSILFSKLFVVTSWISSTLDRILHIGTELYASIRNSYGKHNDYLLINELPQSLHIDALNTDFNLDISTESQVGLISTNEYLNPDVGMSLYESLQTCYLCYESCFVTFGVNTFSVMRINDRFYVFDSHSRDKHGMMTPDGTSVLIEMNDIMEVNNHCMNLSLSMNLPSNTQFEVTERRNELCHYIGLPTDKTDTLAAEGILHAPKSSKTITGL